MACLAAGVVVIGATSRPDLLDAALLRPGRLDRLLMCPFPDSRERVAIMEALARRTAFDGLVSWMLLCLGNVTVQATLCI